MQRMLTNATIRMIRWPLEAIRCRRGYIRKIRYIRCCRDVVAWHLYSRNFSNIKKKLVLLAHGFVGGDVSSRRTPTPVSREDT